MENVRQKSFAAHKSPAKPAVFWHNSDVAFSSLVDGWRRPYDIYESLSGNLAEGQTAQRLDLPTPMVKPAEGEAGPENKALTGRIPPQ
jgi:hypothetical protein